MSTEIFKVGDQVFDIRYGWGEIVKSPNNIIVVNFETYTQVGYNADNIKLLSFAEYDLISGGWSQDRSVMNQPKKGDLVYVRDSENEIWIPMYYSHTHNKTGLPCVFADQKKDGATQAWRFMEVENPLLKEKE